MKASAVIVDLALGTIVIASLAQDSDTAEQPADQQETTAPDPEESSVEIAASDNSQSDKVSDNEVGSPPGLQANATEDSSVSFLHPERPKTFRDFHPFLGYLAGTFIGFGGMVFSAGGFHKLPHLSSR